MNRLPRHIAIALIAGALPVWAAGCDALSEWGGGGNEIVGVCQRYDAALKGGDWPAAYDLLTGRQLSQWDLIWRRAMADNRLIKSRTTDYDTPAVNGDRAVVRATSNTEYNQATEASMYRTRLAVAMDITLRKVGGEWKIEAIDPVHVQ